MKPSPFLRQLYLGFCLLASVAAFAPSRLTAQQVIAGNDGELLTRPNLRSEALGSGILDGPSANTGVGQRGNMVPSERRRTGEIRGDANRWTALDRPTAPSGRPAALRSTIPQRSAGRAATPANELSDPLVLGPEGGAVPDMAADRFGRVHVVWQGSDSFVWYSQVAADGTVAIPATKVYDTVRVGFPRIALDAAGDAHVVVPSTGGAFTGVIYLKVSGGSRVLTGAFQMFPPNTLFEHEQDSWPSIAINPVTQLPVIAADVTTSYTVQFGFPFPIPVTVWNEYVRTVSLDAAGKPISYSTPYSLTQIPSPQYRAQYSSVAVDSVGTTHVVWVHRDPEWISPSVGYANGAADSWVEIANGRNVAGLTGRPRIITGEGSTVEVVWATADGATIWQELSHGGLTMVDDTIVSQPGSKGRWPGIASGFGNLICAWSDSRDAASTQIYSRSLLEGLPESNVSESPVTAFNSVVALPSADRVAFAYQDTRSGSNQIYYREHRTVIPEMADLVPTITFDTRDARFLPGKPVNVHVFIRNRGKQPARGTVLLKLSLSQEGLSPDSKLKLGEFTLPLDLEGGQTVEWARSVELIAGPTQPLDRAGSRRFVAEVNRNHAVEEADYLNNGATSECFFMGEVINVMTHGFNPRPPTLWLGGEPWEKFWKPFEDMAFTFDTAAEPSTLLFGHIHSEVVKWDSVTGFWNAFVDLFTSKIAAAQAKEEIEKRNFVQSLILISRSDSLNKRALLSSRNSRATLNEEVNREFRQIVGKRLLEDRSLSRRFQFLHFIGHSRGAAFNARLSLRLARAGYLVNEFTALDGFGMDWPAGGGGIGDLDIVAETKAEHRTNFRVDQGIAAYVIEEHFLEGVVGAVLDVSAAVREDLAKLDLRAPERSGFDNKMATSTRGPVNHVNISSVYNESSHQPIEVDRYIFDNILGRHRFDSLCGGEFVTGSGQRLESARVRKSDLRQDLSEGGDENEDFRDGTFNGVGELLAASTDVLGTATGIALVDEWFRQSWGPSSLLAVLWRTNGMAAVSLEGTNSVAKLTQTTNTSITQLIQLLGGRKTVEFDLRAVAAGAGDTIQVIVGDTVASEVPLTTSGAFKRHSVRVDSFSDWKPVGFRLGGPAEVPSEVWLDNLAIVYAPPRIKRAERLPDGRVKLVIETVAGASFALDVSRDLENWFERSVITATQNEVEHVEDFQEGTPALFYRLRSVSSEVGTR